MLSCLISCSRKKLCDKPDWRISVEKEHIKLLKNENKTNKENKENKQTSKQTKAPIKGTSAALKSQKWQEKILQQF